MSREDKLNQEQEIKSVAAKLYHDMFPHDNFFKLNERSQIYRGFIVLAEDLVNHNKEYTTRLLLKR